MDYDERVLKGAALLDTFFGVKWREEIDPNVLDMEDANYCVLGQLFGNYYSGIDKINYGIMPVLQRRNCGFAAYDGLDDAEWYSLTRAWKKHIFGE